MRMPYRQEVPVLTHALELECPHCGAPMGVRLVTPEQFERSPGFETRGFTNHNDDELDLTDEQIDAVQHIKCVSRTCSSCRSVEY